MENVTLRKPCTRLLAMIVLIIVPAQSFVPSRTSSWTLSSNPANVCAFQQSSMGSMREDADVLPLSSFDKEKLQHMETRGRVMPIIVMGEPLIPGQRLYFRSGDPKFEGFVRYIAHMEEKQQNALGNPLGLGNSVKEIEVGILGFDPHSKQVLQTGVTAPMETSDFEYRITAGDTQERAITTSFKGNKIFQMISDPWMDPTGSFHMAHVQIMDRRFDDESVSQSEKILYKSEELFSQIPGLVDYWMELMFEAGLATPASLRLSLGELFKDSVYARPELGDEKHKTSIASRRVRCRKNNYALYPPMRKMERAIWTVALLNPIRRYPMTVSEEIRPAFLACRNDRDRLALCVSALSTSIGFLETYLEAKKRLNGDGGGDTSGTV